MASQSPADTTFGASNVLTAAATFPREVHVSRGCAEEIS